MDEGTSLALAEGRTSHATGSTTRIPVVFAGVLTVAVGFATGCLVVDNWSREAVALPTLLGLPGIVLLVLAIGGIRTGPGVLLSLTGLAMAVLAFCNVGPARVLFLLLLSPVTGGPVICAVARYKPQSRSAARAKSALITLSWLFIVASLGALLLLLSALSNIPME